MEDDHLGLIFKELRGDLDKLKLKGSNPLVFQYTFIDFGNEPTNKAIFMIFYQGFPILVIPDKSSTYSSFD
ncbi:hypothetical protein [Rubrolithibacter danxiaensis]|uniref:hypothetical protein n=1 Tax=Rubrolithibacter danxiaensis TaxID=3390805 RepID=UPI003BF7CCC9